MIKIEELTSEELSQRQRASELALIAKLTFPHSSAKPNRTGTCVDIYIGNFISRQLRFMFDRNLCLFVWLGDKSINIEDKRQLEYAIKLAQAYEAEGLEFKVKKSYIE